MGLVGSFKRSLKKGEKELKKAGRKVDGTIGITGGKKILKTTDQQVRKHIPGGWKTVALVAGGAAAMPYLTAGAAGGAGAIGGAGAAGGAMGGLSTGGAILGGAQLGLGALGLYQSNKNANKMADLTKEQIAMQRDIGNRQMDIAEGYYSDWKDNYSPYEHQMLSETFSPNSGDYESVNFGINPLEYDNSRYGVDTAEQLAYYNDPRVNYAVNAASGDVSAEFDGQRQHILSMLSERGVNPNSGAYASINRDLGIRAALARTSAKNSARIGEASRLENQDIARNNYYNERDYARTVTDDARLVGNQRQNDATNWGRKRELDNQGYARKFDMLNMGRNLQSNSAAGMSSAAATAGNAGNTSANMLNTYANASGDSARLMMGGLGSLMNSGGGGYNKDYWDSLDG